MDNTELTKRKIFLRPSLNLLSRSANMITMKPVKLKPSPIVMPSGAAAVSGSPKMLTSKPLPESLPSITGHIVSWTNRSGQRRTVFHADANSAERHAAAKRKLQIDCEVKAATIKPNWS